MVLGWVLVFLINIASSYADIIIPNNSILPSEVIKIQLSGLMNNDKNPRSWYERIVRYKLEIRRLTQTINTNPQKSRLSDLYIARGNSKRRLLETKLKRKLTKSDDNIGMCTDYKKGLVLFSKPSDYTNKPPSYIKKLLKEYCKLSFWESIKFSFK